MKKVKVVNNVQAGKGKSIAYEASCLRLHLATISHEHWTDRRKGVLALLS